MNLTNLWKLAFTWLTKHLTFMIYNATAKQQQTRVLDGDYWSNIYIVNFLIKSPGMLTHGQSQVRMQCNYVSSHRTKVSFWMTDLRSATEILLFIKKMIIILSK